jgi:hypothetical protein
MLGNLPQSINISGKDFKIITDYRNILAIIQAFNDPDLKEKEKMFVCLYNLYEDFEKIDIKDIEEAYKKAIEFIECGAGSDRPSPRVVNWEKDEQLIFAAVNKVAGFEVRSAQYMHWWTFVGYFQNIEKEDTWGYILTLRQKRARGKTLESYEKEFWNANKEICMLDFKNDKNPEEQLVAIFNDILKEQKEKEKKGGN